MRFNSILLFTILTCVLFTYCAPKHTESYSSEEGYQGNISISGAFALYPLVVMWSEDFKKIHPNVRFNISAGGAGKGIADVLTNMVDIGLVSRDLHPQEKEQGALPLFVAKDAVLCTYNSQHPNASILQTSGITKSELEQIFINQTINKWSSLSDELVDKPIQVYVRSDAAGAAETWAKFFKHNQEDLKGVGIFGDPGLAQAIKDNTLAIGFNNINYIYDLKSKKYAPKIAVLPIDLNENGRIDEEENFYDNLDLLTDAVAKGKYPSPPSRDLMMVINPKQQSKLVKAFLAFVLANEQQTYLLDNGYVPLSEQQRLTELEKIKYE